MSGKPTYEKLEQKNRELKRQLVESKQLAAHFKCIFRAIPDATLFADTERRIVAVNPSFSKKFGYAEEELLGRNTSIIYSSKEDYEEQGRIRFNLTTEEKLKSYEVNYRKKNGEIFPAEVVAATVKDDENAIGFLGILRDITERKQAEKELKESEDRYRNLFEKELDAVLVFDTETLLYEDANQAALSLYGYSKKEFLRLTPLDISNEQEKTREKINKTIDSGLGRGRVPLRYFRRKDGTVFPGDVATSLFARDNKKKILMAVRDITERLQIEKELTSANIKLRELALHLQSATEEERTNVAREIHDELGGALTALKLDIAWLGNRQRDKELADKAGRIMDDIDQAITAVQRISTELRPGILDHLGLAAAVEWQVGEFMKRTNIACNLKNLPEDIVIDQECSTAAFRIMQESMTNIIRHAKATEVQVRLDLDDGKLHLEVQDNGKGFELNELSRISAYGLTGMRERARGFHGDFIIESTPGQGTTIRVMIPASGIRR